MPTCTDLLEAFLNERAHDTWRTIDRSFHVLPPPRFAAYALSMGGLPANDQASIIAQLEKGMGRALILWQVWSTPEAHLHPFAIRHLPDLLIEVETNTTIREILQLDGAALVNVCYGRFLGRGPEPAGLAYWLEILRRGLPKEYVVWLFRIRSAAGMHGALPPDYSILEDWIQNHLSASLLIDTPDDVFLALAFLRVLGRHLDPASAAFWQACLHRGYDRWDIIALFLYSKEARPRRKFLLGSQFIDRKTYRQLRWRKQRLRHSFVHSRWVSAIKRQSDWFKMPAFLQHLIAGQAQRSATLEQKIQSVHQELSSLFRDGANHLSYELGQTRAELLRQNATSDQLLQEQESQRDLLLQRQDELAAALRAQTTQEIAELKSAIQRDLDALRRSRPNVNEELAKTRNELLARRATFVTPNAVLLQHAGFVMGVPAENWALVATLLYGNQWEPATQKILAKILHPGMVAVDVGAHIGLHTLIMARAVGPQGRLIAFEPTDRARDILERNVFIQGFRSRVTILPMAVGDSCGTASFGVFDNELTWSSLYPIGEPTREVQVPLTTLDAALAEYPRIDLVKIDAEGAELPVLKGMRGVVARNPQIKIIMEFGPSNMRHAGIDQSALLAEITAQGFAIQAINEETGDLDSITPESLRDTFSVNLLLSRRA